MANFAIAQNNNQSRKLHKQHFSSKCTIAHCYGCNIWILLLDITGGWRHGLSCIKVVFSYQKMNAEFNNGTFWHRAMLVASLVTILVILTASCIRYPCCPSTYIEFLFGNQCNVPLFGADCMYLRHQSQIFCQGRAKLWGFPPFDLPSWSMQHCSSNMEDYQTANDSVKTMAHTCALFYQAPGIPHSDLNPTAPPSHQAHPALRTDKCW